MFADVLISLLAGKGLRMRLDPLVRPRSVANGIVIATDRDGPGRAVMESLGMLEFASADVRRRADFTFTRQRTAHAT